MKGKFSFNLAPIKVPTKAETKALKESLATRDIATPSSPFINRRILSPHTEAELRAACEAVLKQDDNSYGQAAALQAAEANAADPLHRSMKTMQARRTESHPPAHPAPPRGAAKPIAAMPSTQPHKSNVVPSDASPERHLAHNLIPANSSRRRNHQDTLDESKSAICKASISQSEQRPPQHTSRPIANERPGTGSIGKGLDSPETSYSTPLSASTTDRNPYASTARTSAGMPSRCSKRNSHYVHSDEEAASRADAEAANWTRMERERHGREDALHRPVSRTSQTASARRSVTDIKEYFRPGSSQLSKSASRDSLRSRRSEAASTQPTTQKHGWRSWGVQRSSSSDSLGSRSGSIRCGSTERNQDGKKGINLNRELPPLPSVDQWKAPRPEVPYSKPSNPTHIANLMQVQPKAHSRRNGHDRQTPREHRTRQRADAGSRTASSQHSNDSDVPMHFQPRQQDPLTRDLASSHIDFDNLISAMKYTRKQDGTNLSNPSLADSGHGVEQPHQARRPSMKISIDQHGEKAPSFSRKASMEDRSLDAKYKNVVQLKADETSPSSPVHSAMGGLKKVFTGLGLGKHKKSETWMDKFERSGVKGGVLIHDEAAGAPVVRY
ncbi:uncharacterized protein K452DRAFT_285287 [Aplosporella prunicola CBS 121167]|uniref:Uncharacterized protein n=1 Tax=Aplosporella prunicola CBS 121167 TaxID=1176127 RepID=A0A6A6BMM4_9PEZI|nr:uncharacterized protein K452DRAFT_285287 [Aplosporella prunicola CBS 121167]KAF2144077.1 hypothetical protein K452DRAFT_285287 [Aplosporella prunicola CBS 121167]